MSVPKTSLGLNILKKAIAISPPLVLDQLFSESISGTFCKIHNAVRSYIVCSGLTVSVSSLIARLFRMVYKSFYRHFLRSYSIYDT